MIPILFFSENNINRIPKTWIKDEIINRLRLIVSFDRNGTVKFDNTGTIDVIVATTTDNFLSPTTEVK